jgi:gamma-glutamyltranspeptidase/glutathione hydrolase
VSVNYRGYDVWQLPPNGQGIAVLQMLNLLEGFDLRSMGHNSAAYLHHLVEAKKLAFEDRARYYADPAMSPVPVEELISKNYADQRRTLIQPDRAGKSYPAGDLFQEEGDTIYLTVADRDRNMVSLIQSNFMGFGSGLVPDGTGFGLQNRGSSFNLKDGHPNTYAPGKRPFHTIIPGFVTRQGRPYLSFGVMGGDMQPQGHVQVLCNLLDFGMTIQEAGDAPRFRHWGSSEPTGIPMMSGGGAVALETGVPAESIRDLMRMGHDVRFDLGGFGGYQAILFDAVRDVFWGASESRKDGAAAGY